MEPIYNVSEADGRVNICLRIGSDLSLNRDIVVVVRTHNGTATGKVINLIKKYSFFRRVACIES